MKTSDENAIIRPFPSIPTQNHSKENKERRRRGMNFIFDETRKIGYPKTINEEGMAMAVKVKQEWVETEKGCFRC